MTAKEYLSQTFILHKKISYLERELERYQIMMNSIPQPQYENERIDKLPSTTTANMKALEKYYEIEEKIMQINLKLEIFIEEITHVIDKLENDDYKLLLKYRYINMMSITDIASKMCICLRTAQRWHKEALNLI